MGNLSIIRRVDSLGRIVIPVELRRMMDMESGQDVEMIIQDDTLVLRRFAPGCVFCGGLDHLVSYKEKYICAECRQKLAVDE